MVEGEKLRQIIDYTERKREEIVNLLREFIRTPSLTFHEKEMAELMRDKMSALGYSEVLIDGAGNAIGILKGSGDGRSILYNGHMDTVPPGGMKDPYSAKVLDGAEFGVEGKVVYGRGASDMKGALAAMVMAGNILSELDVKLRGDLIVTGTVQEEVPGMLGPKAMLELNDLRPDAALIGECSNLNVAIGHRGAVRHYITTYGKSCHISVQERGINALYKMIPIIEEIRRMNPKLPSHPVLGRSSWGVGEIEVRPNVFNIVPDYCRIIVDTRNTPNFPVESITRELNDIVERLSRADPELKAEVSLWEKELESWTPYRMKCRAANPGFYIEPESWLVKLTVNSVKQVRGEDPELIIWGFGTEAPAFTSRGIATIGLGPGEERFTHSVNEVISINQLVEATKIYAVLAVLVCGVE